MGRQYRFPRAQSDGIATPSAKLQMTQPQVVTTSSKLVAIPNYGLTEISTANGLWGAGDYVLDAPFGGAIKVICTYATSSSVAVVIWGSTDKSVAFGQESGGDKYTKLSFAASTADSLVMLFGINSTKWVVLPYPPMTTIAAPVAFSS